MTSSPTPKPLADYLRELYAAKDDQRRRDAQLPFEDKIAIVLDLQEASALIREARPSGPRIDIDR
jgi:hypothetical protein